MMRLKIIRFTTCCQHRLAKSNGSAGGGGKIFGVLCDNRLFIKPTSAGRAFIGDVVEAPPYEGAKPSFLIDEKIEDRQWLSELVRLTVKELPEPKPKKAKRI